MKLNLKGDHFRMYLPLAEKKKLADLAEDEELSASGWIRKRIETAHKRLEKRRGNKK